MATPTPWIGLALNGVNRMLNRNRRIAYEGIMAVVGEVEAYALNAPKKLTQMQEEFFQRNPNLYTAEEKYQITYSLATANFKLYLVSMSLENLWTISENTKSDVLNALENSLDKLEITDDELIASSFLLEGLLFQGVAFLDVYMLYLLQFLGTGYAGSITSVKRFLSKLDLAQEPILKEKAIKVREYFEGNVVGEGKQGEMDTVFPTNWGTLLRSLRDKIAHRDRVRPVFESNETLIGDVLFDWPTLQGLTYDRFAQSIQNGMFNMIYKLCRPLYGLEWYTGPYNPDFRFD